MRERLTTAAGRAVHDALAALGVEESAMAGVLANVVRDFAKAGVHRVVVDRAKLAALQDVAWFNAERVDGDADLRSWGRVYPVFIAMDHGVQGPADGLAELVHELDQLTELMRRPATRSVVLHGTLRRTSPVVVHGAPCPRPAKADQAVHCVVGAELTATPLQRAALLATLAELRTACLGAEHGAGVEVQLMEVVDDGRRHEAGPVG